MKILGIETSCDETGVGLYDSNVHNVTHSLATQIDLHNKYGGVVPELASRDHIRKLLPMIEETLSRAKTSLKNIDAIAYTKGPGLVGALLVGASFAKSLAWSLGLPVVGINHLEAHILAVMLEKRCPKVPFLALLVSGGHTMLILVKDIGQYNILGETLDDAVGECFDKTAKLIGLRYPGGPAISKLALEGEQNRFKFPRPMVDRDNLDFSFSGLKTHVKNSWGKLDKTDQDKADIARALEDTIVEILKIKCQKAMTKTGLCDLVLVGGVAANRTLRSALSNLMEENKGNFFCPDYEYCTDNGAMIAYTGYCHLQKKDTDKALAINVYPKWPLSDVQY